MRDVTEADVPRMSFEDNDWSAEQFLELLGTPGAVGLIEDGDFVLGLAIGEEGDQAFYAIRVRLTDADTEADTDASVNWTTFATVWASITPTSGTAIGAPNADLQGVVEYMVAIRYYAGVDQGMQVVDQVTGLTLDVLSVLDINEVHRQMHLQCVSRKFVPV